MSSPRRTLHGFALLATWLAGCHAGPARPPAGASGAAQRDTGPNALPTTTQQRVQGPVLDFGVPPGFSSEGVAFYDAEPTDPLDPPIVRLECRERAERERVEKSFLFGVAARANVGPWPGLEYEGEKRSFVAETDREIVIVVVDLPEELPVALGLPPPARTFPVDTLLASISRPGRARTRTPSGWQRHRARSGACALELDLPAWLLAQNSVRVTGSTASENSKIDSVELSAGVLSAGERQRGVSRPEFLPCATPSGKPRPERHFPLTLGGKTTALAWCVQNWPGFTHLEAEVRLDDARRLWLVASAGSLHDDGDLDELVNVTRLWAATIVVHPL